MKIAVTLEDHVGERVHPQLGVIPEKLPQKRIFASINDQAPALVGYVGTQDNAPVNLIVAVPQEIAEAIAGEVRLQMATVGPGLAVAPAMQTQTHDDADEATTDEATTDE